MTSSPNRPRRVALAVLVTGMPMLAVLYYTWIIRSASFDTSEGQLVIFGFALILIGSASFYVNIIFRYGFRNWIRVLSAKLAKRQNRNGDSHHNP